MFKKILVPTDGSEFANQAIEKAAKMAEAFSSELLIVTINPPLSTYAPPEVAITISSDEYAKNVESHARHVLDEAKKTCESFGVTPQTMFLSEHHEAEGIIDAAKQANCDLILMASHGRRGLTKFLLGSTAQEVVTRAEIPVMIIKK